MNETGWREPPNQVEAVPSIEWVLNILRTLAASQRYIEGIDNSVVVALERAIKLIEPCHKLAELLADKEKEISRLTGIAAKYAREHTEFESLEVLNRNLDATQRGLMAQLGDERKKLKWWTAHTEQLEKNWERLVEIARQERNRAISSLVRIRAMAASMRLDERAEILRICDEWQGDFDNMGLEPGGE